MAAEGQTQVDLSHKRSQPDEEEKFQGPNSAVSSDTFNAGGGGDEQPLTKKQRRALMKNKHNPNRIIAMAAKFNDSRAAMEEFRASRTSSGPQINPSAYNTLMHLCTGGENWERVARGEIVAPAPPHHYGGSEVDEWNFREPLSLEELLEAYSEVEAVLEQQGIKSNEIICTCRCRRAMLQGDPEASLALALKAQDMEMTRLRTFTPSLLGFSLKGNMDGAFRVKDAIEAAGHELTESEYLLLLEGSRNAGCFESAQRIMQAMKSELVMLQDGTLNMLQSIFESKAAASAIAGKADDTDPRHWQVVADAKVTQEGRCESADGTLKIIDLTAEEMEEFAEGIARIAREKGGKPADFEKFIEWLEKNPCDTMIDGANVALYGQNFEDGGFSFPQIRNVMNKLSSREPERRQLLVLHTRRVHAPPAKEPEAADMLGNLRAENRLYTCQKGSNDDWYWMYAAVKAGARGMIVSNDEMRDHIFSLLAPKYFHRWKQHHQIRYTTGPSYATLQYPPKFTTCIQELENGAWMFPAVEGKRWLCARPVTIANDTPSEQT